MTSRIREPINNDAARQAQELREQRRTDLQNAGGNQPVQVALRNRVDQANTSETPSAETRRAARDGEQPLGDDDLGSTVVQSPDGQLSGSQTFGVANNQIAFNDTVELPIAERTTSLDADEPANQRNQARQLVLSQVAENILENYEQVTYNWRFFMGSDLSTYDSIGSEDVIVIAETGSTGFFINDVTFDSVIAPNSKTFNSSLLTASMTIVEPLGASLYDRMIRAARTLGVNDYLNAPLWLELSFRGYNGGIENSFEGGELNPEALAQEKRLWRVKIYQTESEINEGGAQYVLKLVNFDDSRQEDTTRRLQDQFSAEASTLGELFIALLDKLNSIGNNFSTRAEATTEQRNQQIAGLLGQKINVFDIRYPQTGPMANMAEWKIRSENEDGAKQVRTEGMGAGSDRTQIDQLQNGKYRITFARGTALETIIQEAISATKEGQLLLFSGTKEGDINQQSIENGPDPRQFRLAPMIKNTVDVLSWNELARQYNTLTTYYILPFSTYQPVISNNQIEAHEDSIDRFVAQLENSNFRKVYNYYFTGLNTNVLEYDIKFNNSWFFTVPIFQGQGKGATVASGRNQNPEQRSVEQVLQNLREESFIAQQNRDRVAPLNSESQDIAARLEDDDLSEESRTQLVRQQETLNRQISEIQTETDRQLINDVLVNRNSAQGTALREQINQPLNFERGLGAADVGYRGRILNDVNATQEDQPAFNENTITSESFIPEGRELIVAGGSQSVALLRRARQQQRLNEEQRLSLADSSRQNPGSIAYAEELERRALQRITENNTASNQGGSDPVRARIGVDPTHSSGRNIEETSSRNRSFFSSLMSQLYGIGGFMVDVTFTIKGDPYWLGEPNNRIIISQQGGATGVSSSAGNSGGKIDLFSSDNIVIFNTGFPVEPDSGEDVNARFSHEGTGLTQIDRVANGFNALIYVRRVESRFENGKFTQVIYGHYDPLTSEQFVMDRIRDIYNLNG